MSLSSTFVAMATVSSFLRVERNDILTQDPLSRCLFGLTANTQVARAVAPSWVIPGISPSPWCLSSVYQTSVAVPTLIILPVSVNQSSKEWEVAATHVLDSRKNMLVLIILSSGRRCVSGKDIAHAVAMGVGRGEVIVLYIKAWFGLPVRQVQSLPSTGLGSILVSLGLLPWQNFPFLDACNVSWQENPQSGLVH